nr:uncharacterized protein LOC107451064 isoform X1 [Parasteatoda tepidariorum]
MDEEIAITSVLADDRKSESSHSDNKGAKELNEKSELIFEIKTICNIDSLVQNCKFFENKSSFTFSDPKQPDFPMDTNTAHLCFHSESFMNENNFERDIPHSPTNEEKNAPKQMQESFEQPENYFVPDRTDKTTPILENEIKLPSENEESSAHHEYQQCTDSSEVLDDTKRSSRRNSKRKKDFDGCCPICGVTVRLNDLESHYNQEVERLSKISRCSKKMHLEDVPKNEAFDLVRKNREQRLTARVARYSARAKNEVKCPVCSLRMSGTAEEINKHVAFCIQDEDSDVNVDDTDSFEEYEIGDETRIRPISLVPGGYRCKNYFLFFFSL